MKLLTNIRTIQSITGWQWGLVTRQQATRCMAPAELGVIIDTGLLVEVLPGVYRWAGAPAPDDEERRAEWLAEDPSRTAEERYRDGELPNLVAGAGIEPATSGA